MIGEMQNVYETMSDLYSVVFLLLKQSKIGKTFEEDKN